MGNIKPYFRIPLYDNKPFFLGMKNKVYDWELNRDFEFSSYSDIRKEARGNYDNVKWNELEEEKE